MHTFTFNVGQVITVISLFILVLFSIVTRKLKNLIRGEMLCWQIKLLRSYSNMMTLFLLLFYTILQTVPVTANTRI